MGRAPAPARRMPAARRGKSELTQTFAMTRAGNFAPGGQQAGFHEPGGDGIALGVHVARLPRWKDGVAQLQALYAGLPALAEPRQDQSQAVNLTVRKVGQKRRLGAQDA